MSFLDCAGLRLRSTSSQQSATSCLFGPSQVKSTFGVQQKKERMINDSKETLHLRVKVSGCETWYSLDLGKFGQLLHSTKL
jgi:hypothetical protein